MFLAAQPLAAQAPFTIRVQQGINVSTIADGGTITMAADALATNTSANVTITYTGTTQTVTINALDFTGSLDFSLGGCDLSPLDLAETNRPRGFQLYAGPHYDKPGHEPCRYVSRVRL
jgi:hypothetical protein